MEVVQTSPTELPGVEVANAIAAWRDEAHYKRFLRRFVERYANIVEVLKGSSAADAAALAHKFRGAAANLWLTDAATASLAIERAYHETVDASQAMAEFEKVMAFTLASIEKYAPHADQPPSAKLSTLGATGQATTLEPLLAAWKSDSFAEVDTALTAAGHLLPAQAWAHQQSLLRSYDFRAGENATRNLIQSATR